MSGRESLRKVVHLLEGSCRCKSLHIWGEESEKWRILPSVSQEEEEDWKKTASRPPFYTLSSPAVSIWLLLCRQCVCALFQASRNVLWSKQKESAHCLWITSLPKMQQRPIFSQKTPLSFQLHLITGAKTIIIIKKKNGRFSRAVPEGFNPALLVLSEQLKRSLYSSKPMTKKLLLCSFVATITGPEEERRGPALPFLPFQSAIEGENCRGWRLMLEALREKKGRKKREQHRLKWRICSLQKKAHTPCPVKVGETYQVKNLLRNTSGDGHLCRNTPMSPNPDPRWTLCLHFPLLIFKDNQKRRIQRSRGQRRRRTSSVSMNGKCWIRCRCIQYLHYGRCWVFFLL